MDQLQTRLDALEQQMHTINRRLRWWRGLTGGLMVLAVLTWALPSGMAKEDPPGGGEQGLAQRVAALEHLLKHFSREDNEVFITGANLHIVNGLGQTGCGSEEEPIPDCPNGLGNLIVGYNEPRPEGSENIRTGSHNVVVGMFHNFSCFAGLVVGSFNEISGDFAVVSGGVRNTASGIAAAVSGGIFNRASGESTAVSGGQDNEASGDFAVVSGGVRNGASGNFSSVSGGADNGANGLSAWVSGGVRNMANGNLASVSGGEDITVEQDGGWAAGSFGGEVSGSFRSP